MDSHVGISEQIVRGYCDLHGITVRADEIQDLCDALTDAIADLELLRQCDASAWEMAVAFRVERTP